MKISQLCRDTTRRRHTIHEHNAQRKQNKQPPDLNGIDYIEVDEQDQRILYVHFMENAPILVETSQDFTKANVRIKGGRRISGIKVKEVKVCEPEDEEQPDCMEVVVDKAGDFSTYTLCLVEVDEQGHPTDQPLKGFDSRYACADLSFKANCPSDFDCAAEDTCPPKVLVEPEINYLARDYASFRQLILDRLALIMPDWQERHIPDIGITLVEILAYVGDYLSYYQDAVATEAYLETARQRISVRRHTRLVDYEMHEGCNARTWLFVETDVDKPIDPKDIYFITGYNDVLPVSSTMLTGEDLQGIPSSDYEVFEPLLLTKDSQQPIQLYEAHNRISFYNWKDQECCLPRCATSATLLDEYQTPTTTSPRAKTAKQQEPQEDTLSSPSQSSSSGSETQQQEPLTGSPTSQGQSSEPPRKLHLQVGDVLIFEEVLGPKTGNPVDADPTHRHAVRLTRVESTVDHLDQTPVVEIEWGEEDKLPFPLCLSAIGQAPDCQLLTDISVARGNVILVDYGKTIEEDLEGSVSQEEPVLTCEGEGIQGEVQIIPKVFRPALKQAQLTFREPLPSDAPLFVPVTSDASQPVSLTSASSLLLQDSRKSVPWIELTGTLPADGGTLYLKTLEENEVEEEDEEENEVEVESEAGTETNHSTSRKREWTVQRDLIESQSEDDHFVVETDNDGFAHLRFGDGELGCMPEAGTTFHAKYRTGNGLRGNVGAESISHIVFNKNKLSGVTLRPRNPFDVRGGTEPEPLAEVKLFAPHAFHSRLERAITADDYARLAERNPKVQRAAATLRWTGSWYEALVAIDPAGTEEADQALLNAVAADLEHYRRMGHDLKVIPAHYVSLDIAMTICVLPHYLRGHVKAALLDLFSNRILSDGRLGFFHPDKLSFGEGIALSKLVATAQAVTGVQSVIVTRLERFMEGPNYELENEFLSIGPMEIARLDNDRGFPEHGKIEFRMVGGR